MIMASRLRRLRRGTVLAGFFAVLSVGAAVSAPITWDKKGAYEACLEGNLDAWLKAQAELLVNEDPAAGKLDEQAVAAWAAQVLARCKASAGSEVAESTDRFAKYVARWRQHIYDLAADIRQKGGSD
jgi:hypothetical protein